MDATLLESVHEGPGHVLLTDDLVKPLRPVLPRQHQIGHELREISTGSRKKKVPDTRYVRYRCSLPGLAGFTDVASPGTTNC